MGSTRFGVSFTDNRWLRPLLQGTNLPPSFWFGTRLRWMQPQWVRWKPHSTWSALSVPRNTQQKLCVAWQRLLRPCLRLELTPTCRTAREGRSQDFGPLIYIKWTPPALNVMAIGFNCHLLFNRTPLHEAVASGNEPVFNQLLQYKQ